MSVGVSADVSVRPSADVSVGLSAGVAVGISMDVSAGAAVGVCVSLAVDKPVGISIVPRLAVEMAVEIAVELTLELAGEIAMASAMGLQGVPRHCVEAHGRSAVADGVSAVVRGTPWNAVEIAVECCGYPWTLPRCSAKKTNDVHLNSKHAYLPDRCPRCAAGFAFAFVTRSEPEKITGSKANVPQSALQQTPDLSTTTSSTSGGAAA